MSNNISNMKFPVKANKMRLPIIMGKDDSNKTFVFDLAKAPHILIGGKNQNEKNNALDTIILNLLLRFSANELKFVLINNKDEIWEEYAAIPHILPLELDNAEKILNYIYDEIERRYKILANAGEKTIYTFNQNNDEKLPYIIVMVNELSEIMYEDLWYIISKITRKARAAGIHLIIGTNSSSYEIVTGMIKCNFPTRICFKVETVDASRLIIDRKNAKSLTGNGDMLFAPNEKLYHIQNITITPDERKNIIEKHLIERTSL